MLQRINELLKKRCTFSIETTLASKSYVNLVRKAHNEGYCVKLLFFWLRSPELAIQRVTERVLSGGHNIPEPIIRRRYSAGISNLFQLYMKEVDSWVIYDNSENPRRQVAFGGKQANMNVENLELFNKIKSYVK